MTSHPRPQRPAATDYFNPAEQFELLQSIKAKVETSATATPQEHHIPPSDQLHPAATTTTASVPSFDLAAHEVSLREKLEKAKAEREAKAKAAEALLQGIHPPSQLSTTPTNANAKVSQFAVNGRKSTEPLTAGPPPPPVLNNNNNQTATNSVPTPTPTYGPAWVQSLGYPQQTPPMGFPRPSYPQFPQTSYVQYGMMPYTNGQTMFPQWPQYSTSSIPGIPSAPPPQQNQGSIAGSPPNQTPVNQSTVGQVSTSPSNQNSMGSTTQPQTGLLILTMG
jgi:hypothetical protein